MDHSSIADSIAAARIAAANAHPPQSLETGPRFSGEDDGQSLANIAQRDLDAALQLLAERAQYLTGASGAAIALRRGEYADMLCRASSGPNAPELGALLSMEHGLSGESVRTRQALRCDDTETDPRVNREGCRQLGIASVVVMPIVSEHRVLGVFELFAGKPHAFGERDLSALQRLGEMVETAVKHAEAAQRLTGVLESGVDAPPSDAVVAETLPVKSARVATGADLATVVPEEETRLREPEEAVLKKTELEPELVPKKPLFWSAAHQVQPRVGQAAAAGESIPVPKELRNFQKCKACGFPVSQERTFCVECEEKKWRGQRVP